MAKGMIPEDHPCYAGVLAHALSDQVSKIYQQADLVVGIGFDPVELNYEEWMPQKKYLCFILILFMLILTENRIQTALKWLAV